MRGSALTALVRPPEASLGRALQRFNQGTPELTLALAQHRRYTEALAQLGLTLLPLAPLSGHPDACFVEDCAVVLGDAALITRPGAPSRQAETASIAHALAPHLTLHHLAAPATLDGGDVLKMGERLFVGRSDRTNEAGFEALARLAEAQGIEAIPLPVRGALHLKSVASAITDEVALVVRGALPPGALAPARVIEVPPDEALGANIVRAADAALIAPGCPTVAAALRDLGLRVIPVDLSEFNKIDGALTCLSILFAPR